jgi:hypothetical protein
MCKEMPVIPVNRVVDTKIIIGKNGGPRRRRGTRGGLPKKVLATKMSFWLTFSKNLKSEISPILVILRIKHITCHGGLFHRLGTAKIGQRLIGK